LLRCGMERIAHIGIAVRSIDTFVEVFKRLLNLRDIPIHDYQMDGNRYKISFIPLGGVELELIEPVNQQGMAQEHLDLYGPGVYHFALLVCNLDDTIRELQVRGFECQHVKTGFGGQRIVFLKESVLPGIFLELIEANLANY